MMYDLELVSAYESDPTYRSRAGAPYVLRIKSLSRYVVQPSLSYDGLSHCRSRLVNVPRSETMRHSRCRSRTKTAGSAGVKMLACDSRERSREHRRRRVICRELAKSGLRM